MILYIEGTNTKPVSGSPIRGSPGLPKGGGPMATKSVSFNVALIAADCAPLACEVTVAELVAALYGGPRPHRRPVRSGRLG